MPLSTVAQENLGSPYAEQLRRGLSRLDFEPTIEQEFRRFCIAENRARGRMSGLVALSLTLMVATIDLVLGDPGGESVNNVIRLGVLAPLLALFVAATYLPVFKDRYTEVAAFGVTTCGVIVNYLCVLACMQGATYALAGTLLVNLCACLFIGLFFYQAVGISFLLVAAFAVTGVLSGLATRELLYAATMLGAASIIGIVSTYNLERALRMSFLERRLLHELAERDGLTGLYNRRIFDNFMRRLWRQSRREETAIEIILIDIDYFKKYNDLYGHQVGDDTLKKVAQCLASFAKRPLDFCARYGGEEFVLVLYSPPPEFAAGVTEQIRRAVAELSIPHEGSPVASHVTISIGVAIARAGTGRSLVGAIQAADEALYEAKSTGRDRIVTKDADSCGMETGKFRSTLFEFA